MLRKIYVSLLAAAVTVSAMSGEELLKKMDVNRTWKTTAATAKMEIHINDELRVKTMEMKGMTEGNKSLVKFTNPEDEGTKYLMLDDNLWIYFPEENDVVKISGHMLKEGMMGSDVSYEDALEADKLSEKYDVEITGEKNYKGKQCYELTLNAKTKKAPYYKRVMLVDKENYVAWTEEMYAKSGKLLKKAKVLEIKKFGVKWYPVKTEMVNTLRKNSKTVFIVDNIKFDEPLDEKMFTMRNLRR
jgi:hypothetical protein